MMIARPGGGSLVATLMWWGNSEGVKGRCDAKCHGAAGPDCDCMCGGAFHGTRHQQGGVEQTVEVHMSEIYEAAKQRAKAEGLQIHLGEPQLRLV